MFIFDNFDASALINICQLTWLSLWIFTLAELSRNAQQWCPKFRHQCCPKFRHQCCPKFHHQCCLILRSTMKSTCTCIKISENSQNTMFQRGFEPGDPKGRPHLPHGGLHIPHLSHWELYIPHLSHEELSKPHVSTYPLGDYPNHKCPMGD